MGERVRTIMAVAVVLLLVSGVLAGCAAQDDRETLDAGDAPDVDEAVADREWAGEDADTPTDDVERAEGGATVRLASATPRRVIRDASVELVVEDADEAVDRIAAIAADADGFVSAADLRRGDVGRPRPPVAEDGDAADGDERPLRGTVVIRIAAEELDRVLGELRQLAVVERSRSITTQEVSGEYADLEARARNLRAYEQELLALLETVREREEASPDELLRVFERVREVREEIERIEQRLADLDDRVALSTVTIALSTATQTTALGEEPELWRPLDELRAATASLVSTLQSVATGMIWLGVLVLPIVALVGLPAAAVGYAVVRRRRRGGVGGTGDGAAA